MIALCAILKKESTYINDWVDYHLRLGFDHIYLYDNDDNSVCEQVIDRLDKITVIPIPKINAIFYQGYLYRKCLRDFGMQYEWITFIDIDEFIISPNFLGMLNAIPKKFDFVIMDMVQYSDGGLIFDDRKLPVYERFTIPSERFVGFVKTSVRCRGLANVYASNGNIFKSRTGNNFWCDVDGCPIDLSWYWIIPKPLNKHTYIKHFPTKSLSEFGGYKFQRLPDGHTRGREEFEKYYFAYNDITKEKLEYIDDYFRNTERYIK